MESSSPNPQAEKAMALHREAISRIRIDDSFAYSPLQLKHQKITWLAQHCDRVLDVGQSSRELCSLFRASQLQSSDINDNTQSPVDIIDDICAPSRLMPLSYDGIICLSVLEHVYDPFTAADNLYKILKPEGHLLLHLPFLFRYHAADDLAFTDCYRFSRDGIAWLLKDFSEVTLYPIRGPYSSMLNLQKFWKKQIEKRFGMTPNKWIDRIGLKLFGRPNSDLQVSGYYAWARK